MEKREVEALWTHLHCLTVLNTLGSFTAAAQRLGVSKAAMSQRITELERAAGIALVRRTTRSVHLTEAGLRLVASTQSAFEQIAAGFSNARDAAGTPSGLLRVTAPVAFARQQLAHHLPQFLREYPDLRIELDMSDQIRSLSREGFDVAVRHTTAPPDTHVATVLSRTRSVLVASRSYLKRSGTPDTPAALEQHDCLFYPRAESTPVWSLVRAGRARGETVAVRVAGPLAVNNSEALRDAAMAGLGIALVPDFSAQTALEAGRLVQVLSDWQPVHSFGDCLYAVRPYSPHAPRAVAAFVAFLKQQYSRGFAA
jgi:DNA-binding transcriptional LysR family regulator